MRDFLKTGWAAQRRNIFKKLCLSEIAEGKVNRGSRNLRLFLPGDRGVQEKNESIKLLSVLLIKNCSHLKMSTRANKHLFTFAFSVTQTQGLNPRASTNVLHVIYSSWNIYEADFKSGFIYQHSLFLSASYPAHCNTMKRHSDQIRRCCMEPAYVTGQCEEQCETIERTEYMIVLGLHKEIHSSSPSTLIWSQMKQHSA